MAGFFFLLRNGQVEYRNDEAQEFHGIADAEEHARVVAGELARNKSASELPESFIIVTDVAGVEVARVALGTPELI
jgi:hypothetical protein